MPEAIEHTRSRNLVLPTVENYFVPDNETVQPPPGAHVLEREEKQNEYGSFSYLKYRLILFNLSFTDHIATFLNDKGRTDAWQNCPDIDAVV